MVQKQKCRERLHQIFHIDPQSDQFSGHVRATGGRVIRDILYFPGVLSTGLFTPDGAHIVTFQKEVMKVFRAEDGAFEVSLTDSTDHGWPVFNHDSTLVSILEWNRRHPRVWDLHTGQLIGTQPLGRRHSTSLSMVNFSPVDDHAMVWDLARPSANQLVVLSGESRLIQAHWSPDGRDIITAWSNGNIRLWSGATKKDLASLVRRAGDFEKVLHTWRDKKEQDDDA